MILTTSTILSIPRCEPWTDERVIEFMNTEPYYSPGSKTLQNFLDSEGTLDIKLDEILWVVINCMGIYELKDFCVKNLELYAEKSLTPFDSVAYGLYYIVDEMDESNEKLISITEDIVYAMKYELMLHGDVTYKYKLYKLTNIFLENIKTKSDLIPVLKKICWVLIGDFPNDINYSTIITDIISLYE
jgi:hypothetical protein